MGYYGHSIHDYYAGLCISQKEICMDTKDEKLEDLTQALQTYHNRFQRLCRELNGLTMEINESFAKFPNLPPEFHADFKPRFMKFSELYLEFGECMEDIGRNGEDWFGWFKDYTNQQQERINLLNRMVENHKVINQINETIILEYENQLSKSSAPVIDPQN